MDEGTIGVIMAGTALAVAAVAGVIAWSGRGLWKRLSRETKQESLQKVLEKLLEHLETSQKVQKEIREVLGRLEVESEKHFQKVGIVRFNPFSDSGGDQSFSLSLLDGHDRGFVISSLHTRQETRIYSKPVANGKGKEFPLSKEEEQAIRIAK